MRETWKEEPAAILSDVSIIGVYFKEYDKKVLNLVNLILGRWRNNPLSYFSKGQKIIRLTFKT